MNMNVAENLPDPLPAEESVPLIVDLDGALVKTNVLIESCLALVRKNPLYFFIFPFWLLRGKAFFKEQVCKRTTVEADLLPYNHELLNYLREQQTRGRQIILATANNERIARRVADHLGLFHRILASNGTFNLSPRRKKERLVDEFGENGFDYAADSRKDLVVWSSARKAILVNSAKSLPHKAARVVEVEWIFDGRVGWLKSYLRALRPEQWLKNLLVFVPLLMAHRYFEPGMLARAGVAFLAFGLCASSVYLINDLLDLTADRHHPRKQYRPFAAGELSLLWGLGSAPALLGLSLLLSLLLPHSFLGMLLIYYGLNLAYSLYLKWIALLDIIILTCLYTMRILAGSASVDIWPSSWLFAFSIFIFFSLALLKRYGELVVMSGVSGENTKVRGYRVSDMGLLASLGGGSGFVAILALALYISTGAAEILYSRETLLWLLCPLLLYWISYVWLTAHRGEMHDDPLVFTIRNRVSRIIILAAAVILMLAR